MFVSSDAPSVLPVVPNVLLPDAPSVLPVVPNALLPDAPSVLPVVPSDVPIPDPSFPAVVTDLVVESTDAVTGSLVDDIVADVPFMLSS